MEHASCLAKAVVCVLPTLLRESNHPTESEAMTAFVIVTADSDWSKMVQDRRIWRAALEVCRVRCPTLKARVTLMISIKQTSRCYVQVAHSKRIQLFKPTAHLNHSDKQRRNSIQATYNRFLCVISGFWNQKLVMHWVVLGEIITLFINIFKKWLLILQMHEK